jgi:hypothetical protein
MCSYYRVPTFVRLGVDVSSIFHKRISLRFRVHFAFGVSENTTKYVDNVRMISSIPSLRLLGRYLDMAYCSVPGGVGFDPPQAISVYARFNRCNPPWSLLPDLVRKFRQSGAEAKVIAPYWPAK